MREYTNFEAKVLKEHKHTHCKSIRTVKHNVDHADLRGTKMRSRLSGKVKTRKVSIVTEAV